jgi:hypothetical protein
MAEHIFLISVFYLAVAITLGQLIGLAGEDGVGFDFVGGAFLWPLMLCALILYGIYSLVKAVVRNSELLYSVWLGFK